MRVRHRVFVFLSASIMKTSILFILFISQILPSYARQYRWVKSADLTGGLSTVDFVDSLHGWTAYSSDSIYRTTNGGAVWIAHSGSPMVITSISMSDTLSGSAVGFQGYLEE